MNKSITVKPDFDPFPRPCPVCDSSERFTLFVGDRFDMGLKNVICKECSHIYVSPAPTDEWLDDFHVSSYRSIYCNNVAPEALRSTKSRIAEQWDETIEDIMKFFENHKRKLLKILDIGCADGMFLKKFSRKYPAMIFAVLSPVEHIPNTRNVACLTLESIIWIYANSAERAMEGCMTLSL